MKLKLILIAFIITGFRLSYSQENPENKVSFTLQEAIDYSLENNVDVLNANLDIERAKKEVWKTTAIGLPQANGNFDYQHLPGDLPTLDFPSPDGGVQEIRLGVRNSSTYSVTVSQLVFSGEYIVGLQAAKTFLQLSENSSVKSKQTARANITSAYSTILLLEESKSTLESSLENNINILSETQALLESGFTEETDVEQLTIVTNTLENAVKSTERQIDLAYRLLKINLGMDDNMEITLSQSLDELMEEIEYSSLLSEEFILENNIDYKSLLTSERISELTVKREKSKFLPTLSAFYLYQDRTNKPDFDVTFNNILGLSVTMPIFSSGQKLASVGQAKIDLQKSINNREQIGKTLSMSYAQAKGDFQTAYESYTIQLKNVELSEKIYEKTLTKYKAGVSSSLELTQVNQQYIDAVGSYTSSVIDVLNAKISLDNVLSK